MIGNLIYGHRQLVVPLRVENNMIRLSGLVNLKSVGLASMAPRSVNEEELEGNQSKLDVDKDGKIEREDLAKLRKQKDKKMDEADNPTPSNDHEVSMANNALDIIIRDANDLKSKLGQEEKDIPAWIQDHISNAANFISQAASNYHEYNMPDTPQPENPQNTQSISERVKFKRK